MIRARRAELNRGKARALRAIGVREYELRGAAATAQEATDPEVLLAGPAGTGKSLAWLLKLHACALRYPGLSALIARKTRTALSDAALRTFERDVLPAGSGIAGTVQRNMRQVYRYPNGSEIAVGGMDQATKVMSTERDLIYIQEATELTEEDWEYLTTRLRNGAMPYQQLGADCNPDRPTHWLKQRAEAGRTTLLESRHEDNPIYWDQARGEWTAEGRRYVLGTLGKLTGARLQRLRYGRWAASEGLVYEGWDRAVHLVNLKPPADWPRYWSVDFGHTNPMVIGCWAQDSDGRVYLEWELYQTKQLVEDMAKRALRHCGAESGWAEAKRPKPKAVICDHDAEDRATLGRHLGLPTVGAYKAVSPGLQAVAERLRPAGDGRPRLFICADALVDRDPLLVEAKRPTSTAEEFDGYVWAKGVDGKPNKEEPVKMDDHGMDAARYLVAHVDGLGHHEFFVA